MKHRSSTLSRSALISAWIALLATGCGGEAGVDEPSIDSPRSDAGGEACTDDAECRQRAEDFEATRDLLAFGCEPEPVASPDDAAEYGDAYRFTFDIGPQSQGFLMVPLVGEGIVVPRRLETPSQSVDLHGEYRHHNAELVDLDSADLATGVGTFGQVSLAWPILVPYAPRFAHLLQAGGRYELIVEADQQKPCLYVLDDQRGTSLDLNIYLVGADGRTAEDAPADSDLQQVLEIVDQIYAGTGIQLGQVRYFDVPDQVRASYRVVRSQDDVDRLTAYGEAADATLDAHLAIDLFLVDDILLGGGDIQGISAGLPGAAGLHGNPRNGLVFQTTDLGSDNDHVAHLVAHELGHYLGLRHTTEVVKDTGTQMERTLEELMGVTDPIEDTPVCDQIQQTGFDCPDADNLMFPAAPPTAEQRRSALTDGQNSVLRANPLLK
ncbi:MAG: M57 family metalloprotease [Persicimonas sp.]